MIPATRLSLCLAAFALTALSGCAKVSGDAPLVFDASSEVKFQKSLLRIEGALSPDETRSLSKAMGALMAYPTDGKCEINNILKHMQASADPAFRQKLRLRRLHGLTAEQVMDVAKEKNCNAETAAQAQAIEEGMP